MERVFQPRIVGFLGTKKTWIGRRGVGSRRRLSLESFAVNRLDDLQARHRPLKTQSSLVESTWSMD